MRVLTDSNSFKWHIYNNMRYLDEKYKIYIIGNGVEIFKKKCPKINFINMKIKRRPSLFMDLLALVKLIYIFIEIKPDIVHSIMPKSGFLASIAGFITRVPIRIHTFTGQVWATQTGLTKKLYLKLDRLINNLNTICLTDSYSQSTFLKEHKITYKGENLPVLNKGSICGVDFDEVSKSLSSENNNEIQSLKNKYNIKKDDFIYTYIARKTKDKGAIDILKAFEKVCINNQDINLKLFFIGPYEEEIKISDFLKTNINKVIDIGSVDNHLQFISITNVLCLPSYREGFGSIIIDAAAMKVPSLGYDIPGLQDSIHNNKTGLLSKRGDIDSFSENMYRLYADNELRNEMGLNAYDNAIKNFSAKVMSEYYCELYDSLMSS